MWLFRSVVLLLGVALLPTGAFAQHVLLSWETPAPVPNTKITGFQVARCPLPPGATACDCAPQPLAATLVPAPGQTYTDTPPQPGRYCYSVVTVGEAPLGTPAQSPLALPYLVVDLTPAFLPPPSLVTAVVVLPVGVVTATADSQELVGEPGQASNAIDGTPTTHWHTEWQARTVPLPHWLVLTLPAEWWVGGLRYLPRQDRYTDGTIAGYRIEVSRNGTTWTTVSTGTWPATGTGWREARWPAVPARQVRLWALSEINGKAWTSAAEVALIYTPAAPTVKAQGRRR